MRFPAHVPWLGCPWHEGDEVPHQFGEQAFDLLLAHFPPPLLPPLVATLRAEVTDRVQPGVIYTTFHHPDTQANVVTTEFSDWATSCPEYKVTAVQVRRASAPSDWQRHYAETRDLTTQVAGD